HAHGVVSRGASCGVPQGAGDLHRASLLRDAEGRARLCDVPGGRAVRAAAVAEDAGLLGPYDGRAVSRSARRPRSPGRMRRCRLERASEPALRLDDCCAGWFLRAAVDELLDLCG